MSYYVSTNGTWDGTEYLVMWGMRRVARCRTYRLARKMCDLLMGYAP